MYTVCTLELIKIPWLISFITFKLFIVRIIGMEKKNSSDLSKITHVVLASGGLRTLTINLIIFNIFVSEAHCWALLSIKYFYFPWKLYWMFLVPMTDTEVLKKYFFLIDSDIHYFCFFTDLLSVKWANVQPTYYKT